MRCAIVHYWLLGMRGGEQVVEALCRLLPGAEIFTLFYDPERVSPALRARCVHTSFLSPGRRFYRSLLPLAPLALEQFDLRTYDLVVSSESGPAKGVLTNSQARHVCYCHSPMRYLWDLYPAYTREWTHSRVQRMLIPPLAHYLRLWDYASAARVDTFVANSRNVRRRIQRAYRRAASVIYPPVPVETFYNATPDDYYLIVAELVAYKRVDDAIRVCSRTRRRLVVVGDGPEYSRLKAIAGDTIQFCGRVSAGELRRLYARCRAVIMPGEEDFGIVAVEALASGKPLIALGKGGVLEIASQQSARSGFFYSNAPGDELEHAFARFEREEPEICPAAIQSLSRRFSEEQFVQRMSRVLFPPSRSKSEVRRRAHSLL